MHLRRTVSVLLLAALGVWAQTPPQDRGRGGARFLGAQAGMQGRVVKNAPYLAEITTEITQTLPDGNHIKQVSTSKVFRDSEGRTRTEPSLNSLAAIAPNSNLPRVVFVQDPVAGTSYALDLTQKTATRSSWQRGDRGGSPKGMPPAGPAGGRRGQWPANGNDKTESLGRQTMEGVTVDGTRVTTTIPAGQIGNEQPIQVVTERWYSPDLQVNVLTRRSDPRAGETVTRLTNISRSEPARSLFEVPADFKVTEDNRKGGPSATTKNHP